VLPDPRPVQATTVLALATPLRAGFAGAAAVAATSLTAAARRSAGSQVGTKGWSSPIEQRDAASSELNQPPHSHHDQFTELDAHNFR
jgi:hypothetical protein